MSRREQYLQRRHNTWHVVVEVPKRLRQAAGMTRFKKSLGTESLAEAGRLKHHVVAEFKRRITQLERGAPFNSEIADRALDLRMAYERASPSYASEQAAEQGSSDQGEWRDLILEEAKELEATKGPLAAERFYRAAIGEATFVRDVQLTWLNQVSETVTAQTKAQHAAAVRGLLAWTGESLTVEEVTRQKAGEYVDRLIQTGKARKTVKRHMSSLSMLWRWLVGRGTAKENPWLGHELGKKAAGVRTERKPYTEDEIVRLLKSQSTPKFTTLIRDLIRLAVVTGARLNELCSIKASEVEKANDGYWLKITDGKTDAGVRTVPVHSAAAHVVRRRLKAGDEFLFAGLEPGGPDKKRSWYVSKAFARFAHKAGITDRSKVFHSFRNTFAEEMERQGVPVGTVKLLVGHARADMTFGVYSKGARVPLRQAVNKIRYNQAVMKLIADDAQA